MTILSYKMLNKTSMNNIDLNSSPLLKTDHDQNINNTDTYNYQMIPPSTFLQKFVLRLENSINVPRMQSENIRKTIILHNAPLSPYNPPKQYLSVEMNIVTPSKNTKAQNRRATCSKEQRNTKSDGSVRNQKS